MTYEQTDRPIQLTTPLGKDKLLPTEWHGREALSELFYFELIALAEHQTVVPFEKLLGHKITVEIAPKSGKRYFNGIVNRIARGERGLEFVRYRMEIVPRFWLLTRMMRSRIFQQKTVPDILKIVLEGLTVSYELQGDFKSREYCVQYRETDFNFACRLMEEEGIFYFFKHTADDHTMVVANTPQSHLPIPYTPKVVYEDFHEYTPEDDRVYNWFTGQEIRSGKCTLWDEHFELPNKHLDADKTIQETVQVGKVTHQLTAGGASKLELYEFPGEYSRHFDGINKGGGEQPDHLQWIFQENTRTVGIRMQQEAAETMRVEAQGGHAAFTAGHSFELTRHFSDDGKFVLTSVEHQAQQAIGTGAGEHTWDYTNQFTCIPVALPYRPPRNTPVPSVRGVQLATVVGPKDEEIFTDKYGRVKVQFHWDRQGKYDADSSCWVRVGSHWAGKHWGAIHIPRMGQEVIVGFEEGDVDHPIIVGSVYNSDQMPPYALPDHKTMSGIRSRSTLKADPDMLNEIRFEDKKEHEHIFIQAQKNMHLRVKHDRKESIGHDTHLTVHRDRIKQIKRDEHVIVKRDRIEEITRDSHVKIKGKSATKVEKTLSLQVVKDVAEEFNANHSETVGKNLYIKSGMNIVIEAGTMITLKVGGNFITIGASGVTIKGTMVLINSGGAAGSGSACSLVSPTKPHKSMMPISTKPTKATKLSSGGGKEKGLSPDAGGGGASSGPTHDPDAEENKDKKHWVEVELTDEAGHPVTGEPFEIKLPDGSYYTGTTDEKGRGRAENHDGGTVEITFPNLDKEAWEPK